MQVGSSSGSSGSGSGSRKGKQRLCCWPDPPVHISRPLARSQNVGGRDRVWLYMQYEVL